MPNIRWYSMGALRLLLLLIIYPFQMIAQHPTKEQLLQEPDLNQFQAEIKQWNDNYYEVRNTNIIIEFKAIFSPKRSHTRYSGWEEVMLTTASKPSVTTFAGSACWQQEELEYNYLSGENEYVSNWEDCYSIEQIYRKLTPRELGYQFVGIKQADDYGEIEDIEYLLVPCSGDCF